MATQRGKIYNRDRALQARDFSGLRWGNITPSDLDACIDFGGKVFVAIEVKAQGARIGTGQRLLLERLGKTLDSGGVKSLMIVAHHVTTPDNDIDFAACVTHEFWFSGRWFGGRSMTVKQTIDRFLVAFAPGYVEA